MEHLLEQISRVLILALLSNMDWESARKHCIDHNWKWSLELIDQAEKEMNELNKKLKKCEDQQKAQRLYNACNF